MKKSKKQPKALITGIAGFVGSHLAELLLEENFAVYGIERWLAKTENIKHLEGRVEVEEADILDAHSLYSFISKVKPDYIFHLAAQSFVPTSWGNPANTMQVNAVGSINLFEAVWRAKIDPIVQIACSSEEYGLVKKNELPIKEENPLRPLSTYAVSKIAMDFLGYQYFRSYGLKVIRTRGFNHTGPRRGESFVCSNFAKQIVQIEKGKKDPVIEVGNLSAKRDFTDVRDMVKAYLLSVQKGRPGETYNICSEKAWRIQEVLDILLALARVKVKVKKDPARMRPSDVPILLGTCSKFKRQTGWKPEIPFKQTLGDLLDYWREKV